VDILDESFHLSLLTNDIFDNDDKFVFRILPNPENHRSILFTFCMVVIIKSENVIMMERPARKDLTTLSGGM
jgi:hypothetical protein